MAAPLQLIVAIDPSNLYEALAAVEEVLDPEAVLDAAAAIILDHTRKRFLEEVDPEGHPWIPSQAAIIRRSGGYTHGKWTGTGTLFESGTLWRSIQEIGSGDFERRIVAGAVNERGDQYGIFAQFGTRYLPPRPFLGINDEDIDLFEHRIMQQLAEALGV